MISQLNNCSFFSRQFVWRRSDMLLLLSTYGFKISITERTAIVDDVASRAKQAPGYGFL
jgi:hypothetical protein